MSNLVIGGFVFVFGLCIGSFLNVCIYRIPAAVSIVTPESRCPKCHMPIRFYDNIPILSFLWLRGRCRGCGTKIAVRYPLIEFLTGGFAFCCFLRFGPTPAAPVYFMFIAALIVVTFIDIDHQIVPDSISLPGIPIGFAVAFLLPGIRPLDSLIGILIGGGSLFAVAFGYQLLTGNEGMGGGDVKLLAMIGAFVGWKGVALTILVASVTGTAVGLVLMLFARKNLKFAVPFGPFLSIGAVVYIFFGPPIIQWYLYGFRPF